MAEFEMVIADARRRKTNQFGIAEDDASPEVLPVEPSASNLVGH